jgi:hypothetical protein
MEKAGSEIVLTETIAEVKSGPDKTVGQFTSEVVAQVRERTEHMRCSKQAEMRALAGQIMADAEGYAAAKARIFDTDLKVKDTQAKGAAAWNDKAAGNEVAVALDAMDLEIDEAYWQRVAGKTNSEGPDGLSHEYIHKELQAGAYNLAEVSYVDASNQVQDVDVGQTLVEWQATQANVASDLTPEYARFQADGEEFVEAVGERYVTAALQSGDMQALQDRIIEDAAESRPDTFSPELLDQYKGDALDVREDGNGEKTVVAEGEDAADSRARELEAALAA